LVLCPLNPLNPLNPNDYKACKASFHSFCSFTGTTPNDSTMGKMSARVTRDKRETFAVSRSDLFLEHPGGSLYRVPNWRERGSVPEIQVDDVSEGHSAMEDYRQDVDTLG
jgi:hypothetical protein